MHAHHIEYKGFTIFFNDFNHKCVISRYGNAIPVIFHSIDSAILAINSF